MGSNSKIEWTDHTWNPWIGCARVHTGCVNCYAERDFADRKKRVVWGPNGTRSLTTAAYWQKPITWDRLCAVAGRRDRVFCASLADVFEQFHGELIGHDGNPTTLHAERVKLFSLIRQTPNLDWMVLTKRPGEALVFLEWLNQKCLEGPLENLWLGVSVSDQATADDLIPQLIDCERFARYLFVSFEPALESIDFLGWGKQAAPRDVRSYPDRWSDFVWPDWVPEEERNRIQGFWGQGHRRNPKDWAQDNAGQGTPATGSYVVAPAGEWPSISKSTSIGRRGRWLHCWNNMGRVVTDAGEVIVCSSSSRSGWFSVQQKRGGGYQHRIHLVICGGESGPGARPMPIEVARSTRDQCEASGIAFHFKQWGEFNAAGDRVGKAAAGRELDGRTWDQVPSDTKYLVNEWHRQQKLMRLVTPA